MLAVLISFSACEEYFYPPETEVTGDNGLYIHYIDVGQGDCALLCFEDDYNIMIDTGIPSRSDDVSDYLYELGVDNIDVLILSHYHDDHMGGAAEICDEFLPEEIYLPGIEDSDLPTTRFFERFLDSVEQNGLSLVEVGAGDTIEIDSGAYIEFFAPVSYYENENDNSMGAKVVYDDTSFLFFGDAEEEAERDVLESGADVSAGIYKVSHHGSKTSTGEDFLEAVDPEYAVISCGVDNQYDHPDEEVVKRLYDSGVDVYRTDLEGTIVFYSDGTNIIPMRP